MHYFNLSQKTEQNTNEIHKYLISKIYGNFIDNIYFTNYNTENGKIFQQSDIDMVLRLNNQQNINISLKSRKNFYNDILFELISLFKEKTNNYYIDKESRWLGWGVINPAINSADCLSYLFENKDKYIHIYIENYKEIKEKLFKNKIIDLLYNNQNYFNNKIKTNNYYNSFKIDISKTQATNYFTNNIYMKKLIFAKNQTYYTISGTFLLEDLINILWAKIHKQEIDKNNFKKNIRNINA